MMVTGKFYPEVEDFSELWTCLCCLIGVEDSTLVFRNDLEWFGISLHAMRGYYFKVLGMI